MSNTEAFDKGIQMITQTRGKDYGHPLDDFSRVCIIDQALTDCRHPQIRHALYMIGVKMARLVTTPDHLDSVLDIAGYARTIVMILDEEKKRDGEENGETATSGVSDSLHETPESRWQSAHLPPHS
ncbi:DUF6378 domain-containing protein [bacterium]|nr:DUF6378 domain-containing protein [bacterium]